MNGNNNLNGSENPAKFKQISKNLKHQLKTGYFGKIPKDYHLNDNLITSNLIDSAFATIYGESDDVLVFKNIHLNQDFIDNTKTHDLAKVENDRIIVYNDDSHKTQGHSITIRFIDHTVISFHFDKILNKWKADVWNKGFLFHFLNTSIPEVDVSYEYENDMYLASIHSKDVYSPTLYMALVGEVNIIKQVTFTPSHDVLHDSVIDLQSIVK